jgi:hypothetical protein
MIISLKYNYIYIRTRKTGSTTIESTLRDHLGPDDIVLRENLRCLKPIMKPDMRVPKWDGGLIIHAPVEKIRYLIRDDIWDGLYKFTSERHPYEKAVSFAHYRVRQIKEKGRDKDIDDFPAFLDKIVRAGKYSSFKYYSIDGKSVVDDFIKLESLDEDVRRIGNKLGIPLPDEMPKRRKSPRGDDRPARDVLTQEQRDIVYEHCRHEFDVLGYER